MIKTEEQLARELVRHLDGVPIDKAKNALEHAALLLLSTQIVSAKSPLLIQGRFKNLPIQISHRGVSRVRNPARCVT